MTLVIGIDVGGPRKGFHAVALEDSRVVAWHRGADPEALAAWCVARRAQVVAVDAPCRWRGPGAARAAERQLATEGISCYYAPTERRAREHAFYAWMLPGAALYTALQTHFPLYDGGPIHGPICVETFPQAAACALAGGIVSAKDKRVVRRSLLQRAGIALRGKETQDELDALLCAVAAASVAQNQFKRYGDAADGFIVVPTDALPADGASGSVASMLPARTVSVSIDRPADVVYTFVSNPTNIPLWSRFITAMEPDGEAWIATTTAGVSRIRFAARNAFGVVDHTVTVAPGVEVFVPLRVVANGTGGEVLFTVFRQPSQDDRRFEEDVGLVVADLANLKRVLESPRDS